jgi:hypothetical protein
MSRAVQRANRVREHVSILDVLSKYGYNIRSDGGHREQQFSCDLHGSGHDQKPSARVYPHSQSWYCFGCSKTRDVIETVRAKEGLDFWGALRKLERDYGLPDLPPEEGYEPKDPHAEVKAVMAQLDPHTTFEDDAKVISDMLSALSTDPPQLSMERALAFWEALDKILFLVHGAKNEGGPLSPLKGRAALSVLRERIVKEIQ